LETLEQQHLEYGQYYYYFLAGKPRLGDCYTPSRVIHSRQKLKPRESAAGLSREKMKYSRNMTLKEVISSCLVVSLGLILIIHFTLFWIYGGVFIYEHNKIILALETIMSIGIIGFGIERLISTSLRKENQEASVSLSGKAQKQVNAEYLIPVKHPPEVDYKQERRQTPQPVLQR
jgi:hypothetical protein